MKRKHLIAIAIGVAVLFIVIVAGALFYRGNDEAAGATIATAVMGAAAVQNRKRRRASAELDGLAGDAETDMKAADALRDAVDAAVDSIDADVADKSLEDLVDEENS